jgi:hypothetical protein
LGRQEKFQRCKESLTDAITIVSVGNPRNVQALLCVQDLLILQHPLIEERLQLLIAVVDAELFKAVCWEVFCNKKKTVDTKQALYVTDERCE